MTLTNSVIAAFLRLFLVGCKCSSLGFRLQSTLIHAELQLHLRSSFAGFSRSCVQLLCTCDGNSVASHCPPGWLWMLQRWLLKTSVRHGGRAAGRCGVFWSPSVRLWHQVSRVQRLEKFDSFVQAWVKRVERDRARLKCGRSSSTMFVRPIEQ